MWSYLTFAPPPPPPPPPLQGQMILRKLKSAYNLFIIDPRSLGCETNLFIA